MLVGVGLIVSGLDQEHAVSGEGESGSQGCATRTRAYNYIFIAVEVDTRARDLICGLSSVDMAVNIGTDDSQSNDTRATKWTYSSTLSSPGATQAPASFMTTSDYSESEQRGQGTECDGEMGVEGGYGMFYFIPTSFLSKRSTGDGAPKGVRISIRRIIGSKD